MKKLGQIGKWMAAVVLVWCAVPAFAQYGYDAEPPRWHLTGSAGFDLNGSNQTILPLNATSSQLFPLGDVRLTADGFLLDPKFLHLNGGLNMQKGVNENGRGSINQGGLGLAISTAFLPRSHVPLRVTYTRNTYGLNGIGVNQDNADSRLDVEWLAMFPNLPRFTVSFQNLSNDVRVPHSFSDRTYNDKGLNFGASDIWKQWQWSSNAAIEQGSTSGLAGLGQAIGIENSSRAGSVNVGRGFWENKARLTNENRFISRHEDLGPAGNNDSKEATSTTNFVAQLSPHWSAQAGYSFSRVDFNSATVISALAEVGPSQVIALTSSTSHAVSGRVEYRPADWLRLGEELRDTRTSPAESVIESRLTLTESISSITAERQWRGFDFSGTYNGRYQIESTSLNNTPNSWSNGFNIRIGWGNTRYVRLTGTLEDNRINVAELIGGYTDQKRARFEAESYRVKSLRLRASVEKYKIRVLNLSGQTDNEATNLAATADHRLFSVTFAKSFGSGAGALFPNNSINRNFLVIPLPIGQLIGTPLLDRTVQARSLTVMAHPRRRLDAAFSWRKEKNLLFASDQFFDTLQFDVRYRMGKVTVEGGYSRNVSDVFSKLNLTGDRLTRWYVRIGRDFTIF